MAIETRGYDLAGIVQTSSTSYGGLQTTEFWTPVALSVSGISWRVRYAGTFELWIDGALVDTRTFGAEAWGAFTFTPVAFAAGSYHDLRLRRVSGSAGWAYRQGDSWVDDWFHIGPWQEAGGGEFPLLRITADVLDPYEVLTAGSAAGWTTVNRSYVSWRQTFHNERLLHVVRFNVNQPSAYRLWRDGVLVGESPVLASFPTNADASPSRAIWIPLYAPLTFDAGVEYVMRVERAAGGIITGTGYSSTTTPYDDAHQRIDVQPGDPAGDAVWLVSWVAGPSSGPISFAPAPVDLALVPGPASLSITTVRYDPAPIDLALNVGSTTTTIPQRVTPIDLPLDLGVAAWVQSRYAPAPLDLSLTPGSSVLVLPIMLGAARDVLHVSGAIAVPPRPPSIAPGQSVEVTVELRRGASGGLLGRFRTAEVERATWTLNGVGEAEFTWVPRTDAEPEVVPHLVGDGEPLSWWDADLEAWIYRAGRLVWCGPVVHHAHDVRAGRLRTRAWSREGYIKRLTYGRAGRTNLLPRGHFNENLTGWSPAGGTTMTAVSSPVYRNPWTMRLSGPGRPRASTTFTLAAQPRINIVNVLTVGQYAAGPGWAEDPDSRTPMIGRVVRTLSRPGTGERVGVDVYPLLVEVGDGYGPGQWVRSNRAIRREAGLTNHYRVEIYGAENTVTWIGEVEAVYSENIGAYAGNGRRFSSWVAALSLAATEYLAGDDWTYDVGPAGPVLISPKRTDAHDHPQFWSLYEDATVYGDWWCPVQPGRLIRYRARRGSYRPELRIVGRQSANAITAEWDAADDGVANEFLALSDGQEGPNREEGGAINAALGARLQRAEMAPPGTLPRDLDLYAERLLATEGRPRRRATLAPAVGPPQGGDPTTRDVPGAIIHVANPGDWTDFRQVDGALDYSYDLIVETMEWAPRADAVAITWRTS